MGLLVRVAFTTVFFIICNTKARLIPVHEKNETAPYNVGELHYTKTDLSSEEDPGTKSLKEKNQGLDIGNPIAVNQDVDVNDVEANVIYIDEPTELTRIDEDDGGMDPYELEPVDESHDGTYPEEDTPKSLKEMEVKRVKRNAHCPRGYTRWYRRCFRKFYAKKQETYGL